MDLHNPIFQLPESNNFKDKKTGRRGPPVMYVSKRNFKKHKSDRAKEADNVVNQANLPKKPPASSGNRIFYEIQFHPKALAKTTQPTALLDKNNIDVYAQISERIFLASSTATNLKSFSESMSNFTLKKNKNDSAYLSAISRIGVIKKQEKLAFVPEGEKSFRVFLILADVLSEDECRKVAEEIRQSSSEETEYFVSEAGSKIIYGSFARRYLDEISDVDPRNPVIRIEKSIDFFPSHELPIEFDYENVIIDEPPLDAVVAVVDSGIFSHPLINKFIIGVENFIKDSAKEDLSHGTFVAGRIVFGNDIENQIRNSGRMKPKSRVLDVMVLKKDGSSDKKIIAAILSVIKNPSYDNVKVFNLSLNHDYDSSLKDGKKSYITRELDAIAHNYNICIIVTAGNQHQYQTKSYPSYLTNDNALITAPGDIVNGLSVGSIADTASTRAIARVHEPSPFTRVGLDTQKKPDLVHFGGNCDTGGECAGVGVKSLSTNPKKLLESAGTSYAAPLVSSIAAQIYSYLKSVGRDSIDLTKALLLHSAEYNAPSNSRIKQQDLHKIVGFGVPDFNKALNCAKSSATFFYSGKIEVVEGEKKDKKEYKHKIKFIVPPELAARGKKIHIRGTLVYTPLISKTGEKDYTLADIEVNLHYRNSKGKIRGAGLTSESKDYRIKWNTIKSFEKILSNKRGQYSGGEWQIWLTLTTRGDADTEHYTQDYALIISIEDISPDEGSRLNLSQIIREQYKTYVPISQRVRAKIQI